MIITIDGPSGTGKSTIARLLAQKLGFSFFDTGAMYRCLAWWIQKHDINLEKRDVLVRCLESFDFAITDEGGSKHYWVSGHDVTNDIRKPYITATVSAIASLKEIRDLLLPIQRNFGQSCDAVFEGRDTGTVVFPDADLKFFLTASIDERGKRRYLEMKENNPESTISLEQVKQSLLDRDQKDSTREIAPLMCPDDAVRIDTSSYSIDEVLEILAQHSNAKKT